MSKIKKVCQIDYGLPISLSTIVLDSRNRQGMYGMQHFRTSRNASYNRL